MRVLSAMASLGLALALVAVPLEGAQAGDIAGASASVGDCVTYPFVGDPSATGVVGPCASLHNAEVLRVVSVPGVFPVPSTYSSRRNTFISQRCRLAHAAGYLGVTTSDPALGRLGLIWVLPTDSQWNAGARWAVCSVYRRTPVTWAPMTWRNRLPWLISHHGVAPFIRCTTSKPASGVYPDLLACTSRSQWLQITYLGISRGSAARDCGRAAARLTTPGVPVSYGRARYPGRLMSYFECFIPYGNLHTT